MTALDESKCFPNRHIEGFIEQYYNQARLHSALGYRPREEFEQVMDSEHTAGAVIMQNFRPAAECRWEVC